MIQTNDTIYINFAAFIGLRALFIPLFINNNQALFR